MNTITLSSNLSFFVPGVAVLSGLLQGCGPEEEKRTPDWENLSFGFKPNILWLSCEDISPALSMYGDSTVPTPNLDRLAREGIVFENAFTVAGVCAPSRYSIITGMYPTGQGACLMRTWGRKFPGTIKCLPRYFQQEGYYCTNNEKTDYNFTEPPMKSVWDDCSHSAHYRYRKPGQPFFAVFNDGATHESQMWTIKWHMYKVFREDVPLPPYYPDNPVVREDVAQNYSNIMDMDLHVGALLKQLEEDGITDSTVIVFWSDHGGPLPRQKREIDENGTHVPMIIRLPGKKWAGTRFEGLVSLMDLGPTMLSICGLPVPEHMQGRAFMGENYEPREYVFTARDRISTFYDMARGVRDRRYFYIRDYMPETSSNPRSAYRTQMAMMQELNRLHRAGELNNEPLEQWFREEGPVECLYDCRRDPWQINNLAGDPAYADTLERLRKVHEKWMMETRDVGLIPEPHLFRLQEQAGKTICEIVRRRNYPLEYLRHVAVLPWEKGAAAVKELGKALGDTLPSVRYWAATGLGNLGEDAMPYKEKLIRTLRDDSPSVRMAAAYALYQLGEKHLAVHALIRELKSDFEYDKILAPNYLRRMGKDAEAALDDLYPLMDEGGYVYRASKNAITTIKGEGTRWIY